MSTENTARRDSPHSDENEHVRSGAGTIAGRYRIVSQLGHGGMGAVYEVEDVKSGKSYAIKMLKSSSVAETTLKRFRLEGKGSKFLEHPNLLSIIGLDQDSDGRPFIVMELVGGVTLADKLKQVGRLNFRDAIPIFAEICLGLSYAHSRGVIHRDLKPSNIMLLNEKVESGAKVKILDFGIAKFTEGVTGEDQSFTASGDVVGSPLYMSPEQCAGERVDYRSDIYSLGCLLFETLTGTPPFVSNSPMLTMAQHVNAIPPALAEASLGERFPASLETLVLKMLAKSPDDRHRDIGEVALELAKLAREETGELRIETKVLKQVTSVDDSIKLKKRTFYLLLIAPVLASVVTAFVALNQHSSPKESIISEESNQPDSKSKAVTELGTEKDAQNLLNEALLKDKMLSSGDLTPNASGRLNIGFRKLTNANLQQIAAQNRIFDLQLDGCDFNNSALEALISMRQLWRLSVNDSTFRDEGAIFLGKMPGLRVIDAFNTAMTDKTVEHLLPCRTLEGVKLSNLTGRGVAKLGSFKHLRRVQLCRARDVTPANLMALSKAPIELFQLFDCHNWVDTALSHWKAPKNLTGICLEDSPIDTEALRKFVRLNPQIRRLSVRNCNTNKTDLLNMLRNFPKVQVFYREDRESIED